MGEHTLQKTARMAAKRNLESPGASFTAFTNSVIQSNLHRVGINLGSSTNVVNVGMLLLLLLKTLRWIDW
jgi:hypothetical protein